VLVPGNQLAAGAAGSTAVGAVELSVPADSVTVEIRDGAGNLMRTLALGKAEAGITRFTWDGKTDAGVQVAGGSYSFSVKASAGTAEIPGTALAARAVEGVARDGGRTQLVLAGGQRIAYGDVRQIL
jgi:flagellar basal-body rod modification protein FlgD